jgi:hypothetical protein
VNVAPFTCMPGTITTAIFRQVSAELDIPIVNLFYDGTGGQNRRLEVYLRTAMNSGGAELAKDGMALPMYQELPEALPQDAQKPTFTAQA